MSHRPIRPASHYLGRWLRADSHFDLGFGYCKAERSGKLVLAYVDVPNVSEFEVLVTRDDIVDKPVPAGYRCWIPGKVYGWDAAVVTRALTGKRYHVSPIGTGSPRPVLESQLKLRWERPLENPAEAIAHGLVEAPTFYEARSAVLDEFIQQRRVSRGLSGAMSAPIELFQHQLDTAARVLGDPVMRYILADEVGLGKTIEAGIIVRQLLIDDSAAKILVLCPETLRGQWLSELRGRLQLGDALDARSLVVAPHSAVHLCASRFDNGLCHFDLIVIDEAHNILTLIEPGSEVERQLARVDGLLALSATPMRGNLDTYRRLLALVDPVAFRDTTLTEFQSRINERERSAADVQVLSARRASLRQKSDVLGSIKADFPSDENVSALIDACRASESPHSPHWAELADYVREIYRLSRRMIRHRRSGELTQQYAVAGRVTTYVEVTDPARAAIDDFLETYRSRLREPGDVQRYAKAVEHALAGPVAMSRFLTQPVGEDGVLFEMAAARIEMAGTGTRLQVAAEVVSERVTRGLRVVVASAFPRVLDAFESAISARLEKRTIRRHLLSMSPEERDHEVKIFLGAYRGSVLLADSSVEEGRNLQQAEVLINLDLPLDINQLEQRIGRLDRYQVRPEPAEVIVLTETNSDWVTGHVELLRDGVGVFDTSVSTVQRLLATILDEVSANLLRRGVDALQIDVDGLRESLEVEREDIDLLEELESVESATVFTGHALEALLEYEDKTENLRKAFRRLTTGVGSLSLMPEEDHNGIIRFSNARKVGLPLDKAIELERLLKPKAFDRGVALEHSGVAPFRVGDPLVDWLHRHMVDDERGRASAIARPMNGISTPALWLHSEFLIEFDSSWPTAEDEPSRRRLARRGETHLQPIRIDSWSDPSGPASSHLLEVLEREFDSQHDAILRGFSWDFILEALPAWTALCEQSSQTAWQEVHNSDVVSSAIKEALDSATADSARRLAILEARVRRLPAGPERQSAEEELRLERAASEALLSGIRHPRIRMVACGACVLCPEEYFG